MLRSVPSTPCCFYPGTQASGTWYNAGRLPEALVFPIHSLTFLPLPTHCSHYSEMNLTNIRTDNYIKIPSTALAMSEAPGGSPMDQVYSLSGNMLNKAYIISSIQECRENNKHLYTSHPLSHIVAFHHIYFKYGGKK